MKRKKQVLVIHPDSNSRRALAAALEAAGYGVSLAAGRKDGLPLMYETHPDVVLLHRGPAGEDVSETLARMRSLADVPVLLTGHASDIDRAHALALGADDFVSDSCSMEQIADRVRDTLEEATHAQRKEDERARQAKPTVDWMRSLRVLNPDQVCQIDRAVREVETDGEVRLIKRRGLLRFIVRVKIEGYTPDPASL